MTKMTKFYCVAAATIFMGVAGCQGQKPDNGTSSFFPGYNETRAVDRINNVQIAAGARADATLDPAHFDQGELNSLGMGKLDYMIQDDESINPMTVWMNVPEDNNLNKREKAVTRYLKDRGLKETQIKFAIGPNPDSSGYADEGIKKWKMTDTIEAGTTSGAQTASSSGGNSK